MFISYISTYRLYYRNLFQLNQTLNKASKYSSSSRNIKKLN